MKVYGKNIHKTFPNLNNVNFNRLQHTRQPLHWKCSSNKEQPPSGEIESASATIYYEVKVRSHATLPISDCMMETSMLLAGFHEHWWSQLKRSIPDWP